MTPSLLIAAATLNLCSPAVADAEWRRAEATFLSAARLDDPQVRSHAALALSEIADFRAAQLLWKTIEKQVQAIEGHERQRAEHEAAIRKLEHAADGGAGGGGGGRRGAARGRESAGGDVNARRRSVQELVELENAAHDLLDTYAKTLAVVLSRIEGAEYVEALALPRIAATSPRTPARLREAAIRALGCCDASEARDVLASLLRSDLDRAVRVRALAAVAARKDPESAPPVISALEDAAWQVRAAAIEALVEIKSKHAVPALIDALEREVGRLQDDVVRALVALTGRNFHSSVPLWREWWQTEGPAFAVAGTPVAIAESRRISAARPHASAVDVSEIPTTSFYGIETRSLAILFVLDVSGSMADLTGPTPTEPGRPQRSKLDAAREEIRRALSSLPPKAVFNVLAYSTGMRRFRPTMVRATLENKEEAMAWLGSIPARGGTNLYDAVIEGLEIAALGGKEEGADTIFLLTDGNPTTGAITSANHILSVARRKNAVMRAVVHCVGVGRDADQSFLARLATQTGGKHVQK